MKKMAVPTTVASAVIAPAMVFGAGTATAVPTCFGFDSAFNFKTGGLGAGLGKLSGFAKGNATVFCFGNAAPFFFTGSVMVK
ncbi:hypothetical protein [Rhodococcus sp. USK13]|uniref:hypothetical protein n=1 Tax=Rhodococcus sp. USK13 TaxID=2806442 RepID=UPI00201602DA|nr:hypothetical protein [Rhodococcus sp. USK13]